MTEEDTRPWKRTGGGGFRQKHYLSQSVGVGRSRRDMECGWEEQAAEEARWVQGHRGAGRGMGRVCGGCVRNSRSCWEGRGHPPPGRPPIFYPPVHPVHLPASPSSVYPSIHPPSTCHPCIHPSIHPSLIHESSIPPSPAHPSILHPLSLHLSIQPPFIHPPTYLSTHPPIRPSTHSSTHPHPIHPSMPRPFIPLVGQPASHPPPSTHPATSQLFILQ